jgi:hypothetical protein
MDRFWSKVKKTDGCWNWVGAKHVKGYGAFRFNNRMGRAHRFSYELHRGGIPAGMLVLHRCDNPACVNPDHLFLGTNADNMADKVSKGRQAHHGFRGDEHPTAKLTVAEVLAVREAEGTHREVAAQFGVSRKQIEDIRARRAWAYL